MYRVYVYMTNFELEAYNKRTTQYNYILIGIELNFDGKKIGGGGGLDVVGLLHIKNRVKNG